MLPNHCERRETEDLGFDSINYEESDDDIDFEIYIANRRRAKNLDQTDGQNRPKPRQPHDGAQQQQAACNDGLHGETQATNIAKSSNEPEPNSSRKVSLTPVLSSDAQIFLSDKSDPSVDADADADENSPVLPESLFGEGSLFFEQCQAPAQLIGGSQTKLTQSLLSSTYGSNPSKSVLRRGGVRHRAPTHTAKMTYPFLNPEYLESLRDNPYTTGLVSYEDNLKEEKTARVGNPSDSSKKRKRSMSPKGVAARVSGVGSLSKASDTQKQELKQTQATTATVPFVSEGKEKHSSGRLPLPSQERCDMTLEAFLRSRINSCDNVLTKYGLTQSETSEEWQVMRSEVQGAVQNFMDMTGGRSDLSADFRQAVDDWDKQIGVRVIQQKHVMYTTLLKQIQRMSKE